MNNSRTTHRQSWITVYRFAAIVLLALIAGVVAALLLRPALTSAPTVTEIAQAVNGPEVFQRPSAMEYVAKTDSCVVGGTVTSAEWIAGLETVGVSDVDSNTVDYTSFDFKSDNGRTFTVSTNGALFVSPGENLGLELSCDPATMDTVPSFGMRYIIYGGK